ncbi:hypothetical protein OG739_31745 [Streptomyces longwoodensis]|uniref:Uncharacterized protein n=1 Tax=Streptomyces lasalocidi TaxID=324833 RepID=A0A4V6AWK0_STRLS|nr:MULTISPECIES: hypothetical protein [Streptomyces]MCX4997274.1 hypothetical protein [Streptomyces longwoodensis]TKT04133.1 hypothetical protein E4U91_31560 [Streptomyces lasalocidi]WTI43800.1 hypothetical protein OG547_04425 [Streptomyces longwoodensis]WUC56573.1 hypothetical protein OHA09_05460 [Streptomyces longwoodensis]WUC70101.1 hypothetical protein OG416_04430 [Streptomyces longwoodensis]
MDDRLMILVSDEDAAAEQVEELTRHLREELLQLDVDDVTSVPADDVPDGARVVDPVTVGSLLVTLGTSVGALDQVVTVVRRWLGRCRDTRPSLRLRLDEDELEISKATDDQVAQAFDLFVRQHSAAGAPP